MLRTILNLNILEYILKIFIVNINFILVFLLFNFRVNLVPR